MAGSRYSIDERVDLSSSPVSTPSNINYEISAITSRRSGSGHAETPPMQPVSSPEPTPGSPNPDANVCARV